MFSFYAIAVLVASAAATKQCCSDQETAVIRNTGTGMVLDGSRLNVFLQTYTGSAAQSWIIEPANDGKVFIINKKTGKALDIYGKIRYNAAVITKLRNGGLTQKWIVDDDGYMENAGDCNFVLDTIIARRDSLPNRIIMMEKHYNLFNEKYILEFENQ